MYAPRQFRSEKKKKPASRFLSLGDQENAGPLTAPPLYSVLGESQDTETAQNEAEGKAPTTVKGKASDGKGAVQKKAGREENPPQFKLKAGGPMQFKRFGDPVQMKSGPLNKQHPPKEPMNLAMSWAKWSQRSTRTSAM